MHVRNNTSKQKKKSQLETKKSSQLEMEKQAERTPK